MNRLKSLFAVLVVQFALYAPHAEAKHPAASDKDAIKAVIEKAYVRGVHVEQSAALMRSGFNPGFIMFLNPDDGVQHITLDKWASRLKPPAADAARPKVKSQIEILDLEGDAAVAKIKLWRDGKLTFTDYMSLYKKNGSWSIVGKIFHRHARR